MRSFREIENPQYGICLVSCECQVFNTSRSPKTCEVIKRGSLAKFQYRMSKNGSVQTLVTNNIEVYMQDSLHYISIDHKLFKYLNAINDFEERVKFYENHEIRKFVLDLERNSIVSVGFSSGIQTLAEFQEINENESKILITVELLEQPFKYSLPANMINTIAYFDSIQKDNRCCIEKCFEMVCCLGSSTPHFDYSTLEYWRCNDNMQNGTASNVNRGKSLSNGVKSVKQKLNSQNSGHSSLQENCYEPYKNQMSDRSYNKASNDERRNDYNGKTVGQNSKRYENRRETRVDSVLVVPTDLLINIHEDNITPRCDLENISAQHNSLINFDSSISSDTSLCSETPTNSLKSYLAINNWKTNEDHLPDNSKVAVRPNIYASKCIICQNYLNKSEKYELLCKHTFCETCIKKQINLETLAHTNIIACCDRPFEQDEIKYFLPAHEYEQFKASYKQQCFDKNCSGYHLWEERVEESSITFICNKCKLENCSKCVTIHVNLTCEQYDKIKNSVDKETVEVFLTWIRDGIAMPCPNCEALIEKDEGCDWVQCPFCNIEICWATRGPRWGSNGKGDTSGGCGCDFKVKKCVENCNYCH